MLVLVAWALAGAVAAGSLPERERLLPQLLPLLQRAEPFQVARPPALVRSSATMLVPMPDDELRPRFSRGDDGPKTSFAPDRVEPERIQVDQSDAGLGGAKSNEKLLAEIRELMPKEAEEKAPPERKQEDLNGLRPSLLLLGAGSYAVVAFLGVQFLYGASDFFNNNPLDDEMFYVAYRFSVIARQAVVAMAALGTSVTTIASIGQLALAVRVAVGIATGELDPTAEREDLYGEKKQSKIAQMLLYMSGNKDLINES